MVGVAVPRADRPKLVRSVIEAIGGEIPANEPNFTEGGFTRQFSVRAPVYAALGRRGRRR